MSLRNRFVIRFSVLVLRLVLGCVAALLLEIQTQQRMETLMRHVIQEMSGLPFVPQHICALMPMNDSRGEAAYALARADALAHVLAAPEARNLSSADLLNLFSTGVKIATGTQDGAYLIDEHSGFILVSMKLPLCQQRHKYYYKPELYVFSRTGNYWLLTVGVIQRIEWIKNRWVGMMQLQIEDRQELYAFVHIVQETGEWRLRTFSDAPNGPGLMHLPSPTMVDYSKGYNKISISSTRASGPLPCILDILTLESRDSCHDCRVYPSYAMYEGTFTFAWIDNHYVITDETLYRITIILSDNTRLEEYAPTEADLAKQAAFLRPGSWRDYCKNE